MPWRAVGPRDLTLLTARGKRLTKLITPEAIHEYDDAGLFYVNAVRVDALEDIADLLAELADMASTCMVRAALKVPVDAFAEIRCRIHNRDGAPARFGEVPRGWCMLDVEPAVAPSCIDATDSLLAGGYLRQQLPEPFRVARAVAQLSSGVGIKPGLRRHLWFMLDRPLTGAELKRLLGGVDGLDPSTFRARQLHYTAAPVFAGDIDDPCHARLATLPGLAQVAAPPLAEPDRPRQAFRPAAYIAAGVRHGGAERYAQACIRRLALAPEGRRHPTCITAACRLLALAKGGELDPLRVASMIEGVMLGKGFDGRDGRDLTEIDRILEWAWATVRPEGLPR